MPKLRLCSEAETSILTDDLTNFSKILELCQRNLSSQIKVGKANASDDLPNYLDLTFIIDRKNGPSTKLYNRYNDFNFPTVNFPFEIFSISHHHHHHHHSLFTHYVLIYNSVMNKVIIRRSCRKKDRNSKNTRHSGKKTDICIHLGSHGASSSRNISFLNWCILPTAEDMNLFIMVKLTPSKGRGKPSNSKIIFCCLSKLLIK